MFNTELKSLKSLELIISRWFFSCISFPIPMLLFSILFFGCQRNKQTQLKINPEQEIISVGEIKLYGYTFSKLENDFKSKYKSTYKKESPKDSLIKYFNREVIDQMYFMAESRSLELDTLDEYKKKMIHFMKYQTVRIDGFLWNELVAPQLVASENEIEIAYEKKKKVYNVTSFISTDSLEILKYSQNPDLAKYIHNPTNLPEQNIAIKREELQWPFKGFFKYRESIEELKEEELSAPFRIGDSWVLLYMHSINEKKIPSIENMKDELEQLIIQIKTFEIPINIQKSFIETSKVNIESTAFNNQLQRMIESASMEWEKRLLNYNDISEQVLFDYYLFDTLKHVTINSFINYYYYKPIKPFITDSIVLKNEITEYILDEYLWQTALKEEVNKKVEYVFYEKWYRNRLYYNMYEKHILEPNVFVSSEEVKEYYTINQSKYVLPVSGIFTQFTFSNQAQAVQALNALEATGIDSVLVNAEQNKLLGLNKVTKHRDIVYDVNIYFASTMDNLRALPESTALVKRLDGNYHVFYKHSNTMRLVPFDELDVSIESLLFRKKLSDLQESKLIALKAKYELKNIEDKVELIEN